MRTPSQKPDADSPASRGGSAPPEIPRFHDLQAERREQATREDKKLRKALIVIFVLLFFVFPLAGLLVELVLGIVLVH